MTSIARPLLQLLARASDLAQAQLKEFKASPGLEGARLQRSQIPVTDFLCDDSSRCREYLKSLPFAAHMEVATICGRRGIILIPPSRTLLQGPQGIAFRAGATFWVPFDDGISRSPVSASLRAVRGAVWTDEDIADLDYLSGHVVHATDAHIALWAAADERSTVGKRFRERLLELFEQAFFRRLESEALRANGLTETLRGRRGRPPWLDVLLKGLSTEAGGADLIAIRCHLQSIWQGGLCANAIRRLRARPSVAALKTLLSRKSAQLWRTFRVTDPGLRLRKQCIHWCFELWSRNERREDDCCASLLARKWGRHVSRYWGEERWWQNFEAERLRAEVFKGAADAIGEDTEFVPFLEWDEGRRLPSVIGWDLAVRFLFLLAIARTGLVGAQVERSFDASRRYPVRARLLVWRRLATWVSTRAYVPAGAIARRDAIARYGVLCRARGTVLADAFAAVGKRHAGKANKSSGVYLPPLPSPITGGPQGRPSVSLAG